MISPFGVDHGVSKAFKPIRGRLRLARNDQAHFMPGGTMDAKLRHHYAVQRTIAGDMGTSNLKRAREHRDVSRRIVDTLSRQGRAKRVLP